MSDRLQFFREQMAAFEGSSDPQKAIEQGYFIEQPRRSLASTIANRIALRPSSSHLLLGGIGSGKTTQLMMARDRINEIEDIHAIYVDASLYTDISEIQPGALIAIVGLALSELTEHSYETEKERKLIKEYAYGYDEPIKTLEKQPYSQFNLGIKYQTNIIRHTGILNSKSEEYIKLKELEKAVKTINQVANSEYGKIVIILDGLDRFNIDDTQKLYSIIPKDIPAILNAGTGIVMGGSIFLEYIDSQKILEQTFKHIDHQPYFDINSDYEAREFFNSILKIRSKKNFIEESVANTLINYSGGVLRDLINLTQASIEEAYLSDSHKLQIAHVETAIGSFGRSKILGISEKELQIINILNEENHFLPRTPNGIKLLATQRILEYQYPEKRYALHPVIGYLFQTQPII